MLTPQQRQTMRQAELRQKKHEMLVEMTQQVNADVAAYLEQMLMKHSLLEHYARTHRPPGWRGSDTT